MTPELWRQVEELYHAALARGPEERAALLAQADPDIRREAESLLAQDASREGLLDRPAAELLTNSTKLAAGVMLGPYRIEGPIGAGGMGEVFRAIDTRLGRAVAIKISSQEFNQRFERESRAISALNHPHICTLHDVGPNYLVMELVEGETLAARLKRGKLSLDDALRYGAQIADALAAAHAKGIVHRDLKPGNIMVTKTGVKVLDFGLAKIEHVGTDEEHTVTAKGTILGTVQYMSPEQAQGKEADARSDIFSFGLVLYEMITGKRAFDGASRASVMAAMLERPSPSLAEIAPGAVDRVVQKCLEKDPGDRWQDAKDLKAALALTADFGTVAKPSRRTWIAGTTAGVVAAGLTGAGAVTWFRRQSSSDVIPLRIVIEPPQGGRILVGTAGGTSCAISPDGRTVAYTAVVGGKTGLWIRPLGGAPRMLAEVYGYSPFWAPDNKSIGFSSIGKLQRVDVAGGAPWTVCEAPLANGGAAWSQDGHILIGSKFGGLSRVPASGGTAAPLTELNRSRGERGHIYPQVLPGGRFLYLALSDQAENTGIYAASLSRPSETVRVLTTNANALYAPGGDGREYLLWQREGALIAQEIDAGALKMIGEPHLLASSIGVADSGMIAAVSANGSLIYSAAAATPSRLTWFNREGKSLGTVGEEGEYYTLRLSPDERQVAVLKHPLGKGEVWILQSSRGAAIRLADGSLNAWSPDGRTMIYGAGSPVNLFRKEVAGSGNAERLTQSPNIQYPDDWSRDGRFIMFQEQVPGNRSDLMVIEMTPDGKPGDVRPWLNTPAGEVDARFSPEHSPRWVVYNSTESGRVEVYIDSFQGRRRRVRVSTDGARFPQWRGDGRELFFQSLDYKLMAVEVKLGVDSVETSAPRELFALPIIDHNLPSYEAAPDGQRFLVLAATEQSSSLTLIINWPALLKNPAGQ